MVLHTQRERRFSLCGSLTTRANKPLDGSAARNLNAGESALFLSSPQGVCLPCDVTLFLVGTRRRSSC